MSLRQMYYALVPAAGGGAVEFVDATSAVGDVNNTPTNLTINVPGLTQDGDFMLLSVFVREDTVVDMIPAGWTEITALTDSDSAGDDRRMMHATRIASSEPASYDCPYANINTREMDAHITVWRGVDTGDPFDVTPSFVLHTDALTNDNTPTSPTIDVVTVGGVVIAFLGLTAIPTIANGAPAGYTIRSQVTGFVTTSVVASLEITSAGTETPGDWTTTADDATTENLTMILAFKP